MKVHFSSRDEEKTHLKHFCQQFHNTILPAIIALEGEVVLQTENENLIQFFNLGRIMMCMKQSHKLRPQLDACLLLS